MIADRPRDDFGTDRATDCLARRKPGLRLPRTSIGLGCHQILDRLGLGGEQVFRQLALGFFAAG